jgi:tRNA G37 N-methylase Trm5
MTRQWKWRLGIYTALIVVMAGGSWYALKKAANRTGQPDVIYADTPQEAVERMLAAANITKDDVVYDLGCGDARFLVTAAKKYGCRCVGVDIQPDVVVKAKKNVADNGVESLVEIREGDMFKVDLSPATVLTMYLLPTLNVQLIPQLKTMRPGSRIVSYNFDMEGVRWNEKIQFRDSKMYDRTYYLWITPLVFHEKP